MHSFVSTTQRTAILRGLAALSFILVSTAALFGEEPPRGDLGQLGAPVTLIEVPDASDQFYMAQETRDGRLYLTPNESFFPSLGLRTTGEGLVPDIENLNGGKSFATIERWDQGDVAEWGLFVRNPGEIQVRVWMTAATAGGRFTLYLGDSEASFSTKRAPEKPALATTTRFQASEAGQHSLKLICDRAAGDTDLHWIEVFGEGAKQGAVLRKRWRPAAAHTKFSSSQSTGDIRLWVMEMDAVPGTLSFYCPITTPFGYYGPTWRADGTVNTSFNFSLWSYGRGKPEPPIEQLSHLLAVGHPQASFGGFGHEGTGVKIRNWEPLAGRQGQRQVLALRVEPGEMYDTYYSYFYAADEKRWRLFGVGNKFNKRKPLKSLWVGSFVEVPGPPHVQRSGPYPRVMRYRGWVMEDNGTWHQLDRMTNGNISRTTGLTHSDRGVTDDGWFYLQTGGWIFRKPHAGQYIELPADDHRPTVEYLTPEHIAALKTVPSEVTTPIVERAATQLRGSYRVRNPAQRPQVTLYWGTKEGLTFADRWENSVRLEVPREGRNMFVVDNVPRDKTVFVRLLLKNSEGQFWSPETLRVEPDQR